MKKRILLVTNGFPFGESERSFLGEEVRQMADIFELYILAPDNGAKLLYPTDGIRQIERYKFTSFRETKSLRALPHVFNWSSISEVLRFAHRQHFKNVLQNGKEIFLYRYHVWEAEQRISQLVEKANIDIIYTYWCTECTLAALYVKRRFPKVKVVTRFHGYDLYEERAKLGMQLFRKTIALRADGLCFPSEIGRNYFLEHWGKKFADKAHTCYLGSKKQLPSEKKDPNLLKLVSCSNVIPLKRIELIIDALALLPGSVNVEWNHFGDGSELRALEKRAKEKIPAGGNVSWCFRGYVQNENLASYYREIGAELFITTSSTEGLPVSIMEAFSMGIPAIGTAVGGIPELVIEGKTGYLLPENVQPDGVAEAILKYWNLAKAQRQEMSDAAFALWQDKFDAEKNARCFVMYLTDLLSS